MIEYINPQEIFSKISFQEDVDFLEYPKIGYKCTNTSEITFSLKHFKKYAFVNKTNLNSIDSERIDNYVSSLKTADFNSFLDFYCAEKNHAIRIYFLAWAGGRFTAGYDLKFIIRIIKNNVEEE